MKKEAIILGVSIAIIASFFIITTPSVETTEHLPTETFDITIRHTRYEPSTVTIENGTLVTLRVATAPDTEHLQHGLTVPALGIDITANSTTPTLATFIAQKGTYEGYCGSCLNGPFGRDAPDKRLLIVVT